MMTSLDKDTALILIDLQKGVVRMPPAAVIERILTNAAKLVDAFYKAGLTVVIVNVNRQRQNG